MRVASASSPSEDVLQFPDLVDHKIATLNLPSGAVEETSHEVFDNFGATSVNRSLPILDRLLQPIKVIWSTLDS